MVVAAWLLLGMFRKGFGGEERGSESGRLVKAPETNSNFPEISRCHSYAGLSQVVNSVTKAEGTRAHVTELQFHSRIVCALSYLLLMCGVETEQRLIVNVCCVEQVA